MHQVLVGEPGIGKNALLSNWVKRRTTMKHRDEFLFQYFAGASTRAKQLSHMLHKVRILMTNVVYPACSTVRNKVHWNHMRA